jgi:proline dehydrogenase
MTTITTVGYGDIGGNSTVERVICIFLHLIGVLAYSFASGSLTSIIANYDQINQKNQEKINVLDRLFKEHNIPSDIYYQIKTSIANQESTKDMTDIKDFLEDLPYRLRIKTTMYLYKDAYENVEFLKS